MWSPELNQGDYNRHHLFWMKKNYKSPLEKSFRTHQGLVIPTYIPDHRTLHADLSPPPKPGAQLMRGILSNLDRQLSHPTDGLLYTIDYLEGRDERLASHLTQQLGYLTLRSGNEIQEMVA